MKTLHLSELYCKRESIEMATLACLLVLLELLIPSNQGAKFGTYRYSYYYWLTEHKNSYEMATVECGLQGGVLVAIPSSEIQAVIDEYLIELNVTVDVWLGYHKHSSCWDDGTLFSWNNWGSGEPNGYSGELCTGMRGKYWIDIPCGWVIHGVCQKSADQANFTAIPLGKPLTWAEVGGSSAVRSCVECAVHCKEASGCVFYHFDRADKLCTLYGWGGGVLTVDNNNEWYTL